MEPRKQITVKLLQKDVEALEKVARENNLTVAEQVRRYVSKGMSVDAYRQDEEKILANMKQALREALDPSVDRIVKISVKNAIASSVNLLFTAMMLYRISRKEARPKLERFMDDARTMGIRFVQLGKGSIDDFLKTSMERLNAMWDGE